jgi:hypothetical protein
MHCAIQMPDILFWVNHQTDLLLHGKLSSVEGVDRHLVLYTVTNLILQNEILGHNGPLSYVRAYLMLIYRLSDRLPSRSNHAMECQCHCS